MENINHRKTSFSPSLDYLLTGIFSGTELHIDKHDNNEDEDVLCEQDYSSDNDKDKDDN